MVNHMSKRRQPYKKKAFESTGSNSDTSSNIFESMLLSSAFQSLKPSAKVLYVYCKAQYYAQKDREKAELLQMLQAADPDIKIDPKLLFSMNQTKWRSKYGIYNKGNERGFYRDRDELIAKGFIICLQSGKRARHKSVYTFSDHWQRFILEKPDYQSPSAVDCEATPQSEHQIACEWWYLITDTAHACAVHHGILYKCVYIFP